MGWARLERARENAFRLFFAASDRGLEFRGASDAYNTLAAVICMVDAGQVIRTLVSPAFGWTHATLQYLDVLDIFRLLLTLVII
jgi:hypothetical protein